MFNSLAGVKMTHLSSVDHVHIRGAMAKALAKYQPEEYRPGASIANDNELARAAGELGTTIFHPVGTCKMGNDAMAVVDDELRVRGVQRLRVVDASIFPRITSGNTNAPTYVIAEKGARAILKALESAPT